MDLNLFENLKKSIEPNINVQSFIKELNNFLSSINFSKKDDNYNNFYIEDNIDIELQNNRKEGHLYLVTEDRNNEIYLWDFTDKPEHEFKEVISSPSLLEVAKEGAMLQYKNGEYVLYSPYGYDILYNSDNNEK